MQVSTVRNVQPNQDNEIEVEAIQGLPIMEYLVLCRDGGS